VSERLASLSPRRAALVLVTVVCFALATLVAAKSAHAWYTVKYVDADSVPGWFTRSTGATADRLWNRIWRPTPHGFCSHYPPYLTSYYCNVWSNPMSDERDVFNSYEHCMNDEEASSYPVTCQTTHP
jgi:hypothetical protein